MNKTDTFIEKAKLVHKEIREVEYDYSQVDYKDAHTAVKIGCHLHGFFMIRPKSHISQKQGCRQCGYANRKLPGQKTTEKFIEQATAKWGNRYDYSRTVYSRKLDKIKYVCGEHGEVEQLPTLHLKHGCPYCNGRGISKHTVETFIEKARKIHGDRYDYSEVIFSSIHDKIKIKCKKHGYFFQKASNHFKNGCPKCNNGVSLNNSDYLERAKEKHGDKFDYSQVNYTKAHDKIKVVCKKHGEFEQLAYMHLQSEHACPYCVAELTSSAAEKEIINLIKNNYSGCVKSNDRDTFGYKEIDILVPELSFGIEYHGNYWHTEAVVGRNYHVNKANLARDNGVNLFQIFESEWHNKRDIVSSRILGKLGVNRRIFARKTTIVSLSVGDKNNFLDCTHIQGRDNSSVYYGLEFEGILVAVMTFGRPRFNRGYDFEMIRYSSSLFTNVVGGAGKLLNYFRKNHSGNIITYADRRWSSGDLYRRLGFSYCGDSSPGYFYYNLSNKTVLKRLSCQKKKLESMSFYDKDLPEHEIMRLNGYGRIWDAGNSKWELVK